ncbi:VIT domain-containing protein [Porticoccus sp. W117]|uniref:VIT and vWA domain-containing protein n=1 Tax=Porticoccus sp. W117 TaxID=3054777 RepID=UPI0025940E36|nr:VIT domain-containing protein [Porticoccus sp. W117]MDM3872543.1 VIT domain-containing protein [Porticoccus sp. W117]
MKIFQNVIRRCLAAAAGLVLCSQTALAAGLMTPKSSSLPPLEIKQHHVNVTIEDGYAITSVEQVFYNPNSAELEAIYSFPVPEKASVGEFTYWIDGTPVTGEVLEKKQARELYEREKSQGRETAITEQDEYRTFDSSVYPVRGNQEVKIRLVYIQPVHVDHSIGRYVYPLEEGGVDEQKLAFWNYNDEVSEAFSFNLKLRSSYPIDTLRLPKHPQAVATNSSPQEWQVSLANNSASTAAATLVDEEATNTVAPQATTHVIQRLDTDIVVYWRHQQGLPGSIDMVAHKPDASGRGTFMMTVTPGDDLARIEQGRDWVFVLDLSGSMQGKYSSLVEGVNKGLKQLNPNDRFKIVLFNNSARELTPGYVMATPQEVSHYTQQLANTPANGGTNLYAGLQKGMRGLDADRPSALVLVTDGVANVGVTEKKRFLKLLEQHDVRLFTFVMGNSANRPLLDGMTKISNGFAMSVSNSDDIVGQLMLATEKLTHQAFHDIDVRIKGVKVEDMEPTRIGSLYRGQQLIVFGHYRGDGVADVAISGKVSGQPKTYKTRIAFPETADLNPEIERLWAYAAIEGLQDQIDYLGEDSDSKQAIVDIAREYGLVTNYTSMVVVRDEVFQAQGIERRNQQRVQQEHHARQQRAAAPVRDNRADSQQPAFQQPRATPRKGGGGGSFGVWMLVLLPLLWLMRKRVVSK